MALNEMRQGEHEARRRLLVRPGRTLVGAFALLICSAAVHAASEGLPADVVASIQKDLGSPPQGIRYLSARMDLNSDQRPELILYLVGPMVCGCSSPIIYLTEFDSILT